MINVKEKILTGIFALMILTSSVEIVQEKLADNEESVSQKADAEVSAAYEEQRAEIFAGLEAAKEALKNDDSVAGTSLRGLIGYELQTRDRVEAILSEGDDLALAVGAIGEQIVEDSENGVTYKEYRDEFFTTLDEIAE